MTVPCKFVTKVSEDDTAKHASVCTLCNRQISAYTEETLTKKELSHRCTQSNPVVRARVALNSPKEKMY